MKLGKGPVSKLIVDYFNEKIPLSHCGVIHVEKDSTYIVHSVSKDYAKRDGVQTILFNDFLHDCTNGYLYVVRLKSSVKKRTEFANRTSYYLESNTTFDHELNNTDKTQMNCLELIYWSMMDINEKDILKKIKIGTKETFAFNSLLDTTKFAIVYHY